MGFGFALGLLRLVFEFFQNGGLFLSVDGICQMAVSKAQQKAVQKYVKDKYDRVVLTMPKGKKDAIKERADSMELSVNAFINLAIDSVMEQGTSTTED